MPNEFFVFVAVVVLCECTKTSLYQYESNVAFFFLFTKFLVYLNKKQNSGKT